MLELKPDALVTVRCGDVTLTEGRMGKVGDRVAVRVAKALRKTAHDVRHVREGGRAHQSDGGAVSYHYGFLVETMVSILLLLTILYCVRLNKQLRLLKADEQIAARHHFRTDHRHRNRRARHRRPEVDHARRRAEP